MTNTRRAVGDTSTFPHMFMHEDLQNHLNHSFLDSLALSLPIAESCLKVLRNENTECVQVSKRAWDEEQDQWSLPYSKPLNILPLWTLTCPTTALSKYPVRSELHPLPSGWSVTHQNGKDWCPAKRGENSAWVRKSIWGDGLLKRLILVHRCTTSKMLPLCALVVHLWNRVNASFLPAFLSLNRRSLEHGVYLTVRTYSSEHNGDSGLGGVLMSCCNTNSRKSFSSRLPQGIEVRPSVKEDTNLLPVSVGTNTICTSLEEFKVICTH